MALPEVKIYISYNRILISNDCGFRVELDLPIPENIIAISLRGHIFRINLVPPQPPYSPTDSPMGNPLSSDSSQSAGTPDGDGGPGGPDNPIEL